MKNILQQSNKADNKNAALYSALWHHVDCICYLNSFNSNVIAFRVMLGTSTLNWDSAQRQENIFD